MKAFTRIGIIVSIPLLACISAHTAGAQELHIHKHVQNTTPMLGKGEPFTIDDLPEGTLKAGLLSLSKEKREQVLKGLNKSSFPMQDAVESLHVDKQGGIFYVCKFKVPENVKSAQTSTGTIPHKNPVPIEAPPFYHSKPGAAYTIFLDFNGSDVTGTGWNDTYSVYEARPYDKDGNESTFNDEEKDDILNIWQRVAEDYAPFDVDVTTEEPSGPPNSWDIYTGHVLITQNLDKNGNPCPYATAASGGPSGGVSYYRSPSGGDVFGEGVYPYLRPAWVYYENLPTGVPKADKREDLAAEAATHEMGHNLYLSHDGDSGNEYYPGHGSGLISWSAIMGNSYTYNVSQWTKGEYYDASNTEDDLAIISGYLTYRPDDHGDSMWNASPLAADGAAIDDANPANQGIIGTTADVDVFVFKTGAGTITLDINPWISPVHTRGGNLDIHAQLYDSAGELVDWDNPDLDTSAQINVTGIDKGTYYLKITGSGAGDPYITNPDDRTGYTEYGSIGQFFISGTIVSYTGLDTFPPSAYCFAPDVLIGGGATHEIAVTYKDNEGIDVSTIDLDDIRVTGPNGYDVNPNSVSDVSVNGTTCTAIYRINAPGGTWERGNDLGTYNVWLEPGQVTDINGLSLEQEWAGDFSCKIKQLYHASMDTDPGWTLDGSWWAYGTPVGSAGDPTDRDLIGYNNTTSINGGCYPNNMGSTEWATTPAIDCSGRNSVIMSFQHFIGLKGKFDYVYIDVSNNGSTWTNILWGEGPFLNTYWYIQETDISSYAANQSTVYIRFGMGPTSNAQNNFGFNVDEVWLTGIDNKDRTRPDASVSVSDITSGGGTTHDFTVTYSDNTAVDISDLDSSDIRVVSVNGYRQYAEFISVDTGSDGTPRTATYRISAGGLTWGPEDNGTYAVLLKPGQVSDTSGNYALGTELGTFLVDIADTYEPVLSWTGEAEYISDGVDPESGDSKTEFEFRVEYSDQNDNPPSWVRLYLDKNGDRDYADTGEILDMAVDTSASDPSKLDGDYINGEWYTVTSAIPCGADTDSCTYFFYTHNGTHDRETLVINAPDVLLNIGEGTGENPIAGDGDQNDTIYYSLQVTKGGAGTADITLSYEHIDYDWGAVLFYEDTDSNGVYDSGTDPEISGPQITLGQGETMHILAAVSIPGDATDGDFNTTRITASFNPSSSIMTNTWVINPLYVELADLRAEQTEDGVLVSWMTVFEADNIGFNVYVRDTDSEYVKANTALIPSQYSGFGGAEYSFLVTGLTPGKTYLFMVEDIDVYGKGTFHGPVRIGESRGGGDPDNEDGDDGLPEEEEYPVPSLSSEQGTAGGCVPCSESMYGMILAVTVLSMLLLSLKKSKSRLLICLVFISGHVWGEPPDLPFDPLYNAVLIQIKNPKNIYKISGSDLSGAGVDISSYPADRIGILYEGTEIPIVVHDGGDNSIGSEDYILFAAEPYKDSYTDVNIYVLGVLNQAGLRMGTADFTPSGGIDRTDSGFVRDFIFETDLFYSSLLPAQAEADHWYWNPFCSTYTGQDYSVDLGSVCTDAGDTGSVTVHVAGITSYGAVDPDHHVVVYINGDLIGDFYFDGRASFSQELTFSQDILLTGDNTVRVEVPQDTAAPEDSLYLDRFEFKTVSRFEAHDNLITSELAQAGTYTVSGFSSDNILLFDITDIPARVTGSVISGGSATLETAAPVTLFAVEESALGNAYGFLKVSSKNPDTIPRCDYIVITAPELMNAASGLSAIHYGLSVSVFNAHYMYAHFGTGRISPYPVRDFLSYCCSSWSSPPLYAVCVSDCANNRTGVIPSFYMYDGLSGVVPADNRFACVSGSDAVPDINFGRIPADTETEVDAYLNKIDAYLNFAPQGQWEKNMVFIADNAEGIPADEIFPVYNSELASIPPSGYTDIMINLEDYNDTEKCTDAVINSINQGALITEYVGHGGIWLWAKEMIFADSDLKERTDARDLFNADCMFPFFISIACLDGYFLEPNEAWNMSLSERLILNPNGGAVGVFSASGFADAEDKFLLGRELYRSFFERDIRVVGDALRRAKEEYTAVHQEQEDFILHTHNLMGDPALELRIPSPRRPFGVKAEFYDKGDLSEFSTVHKDKEKIVEVSWRTQDTDANLFRIYRSCDGGVFAIAGTVSGDSRSYADKDVCTNRNYQYYVVAGNHRGLFSAPSETVSIYVQRDEETLFGCSVSNGSDSCSYALMLIIFLSFILLCRRRKAV